MTTEEEKVVADEEVELDFGEKKKKKKAPKAVVSEESAEAETAEAAGDDDEEMDFGKKKKKSKAKGEDAAEGGDAAAAESDSDDGDDGDADADAADDDAGAAQGIELDIDRTDLSKSVNYTYEQLLGRIVTLVHSFNPELCGKREKRTMKPPQVCREGSKKTVWINFQEMCELLHRTPDHLLSFVLTEMGTNGSLDGAQRLIIKGRYNPKQIESFLRNYIVQYVTCKTCYSPDTHLMKEDRLWFLCCNACQSTRSVPAIKKGYEAQIGRRKRK